MTGPDQPQPSGSSPTIRPARPDDAPVVVALIKRLAAFERSPDAARLTEQTVLRDVFGPDPRLHVLLGEAGGVVRAILTLIDGYSSWAAAPSMTVHDLFVDEAARGLGLGRLLLDEAAALARRRGAVRLDVNVLAWNSPARAFYAARGFGSLDDWLPYRLDLTGQ